MTTKAARKHNSRANRTMKAVGGTVGDKHFRMDLKYELAPTPGTPASVRRKELDDARFVLVRNLAYMVYKKADETPLMLYGDTCGEDKRDLVKTNIIAHEISLGLLVNDNGAPVNQQPVQQIIPQQAASEIAQAVPTMQKPMMSRKQKASRSRRTVNRAKYQKDTEMLADEIARELYAQLPPDHGFDPDEGSLDCRSEIEGYLRLCAFNLAGEVFLRLYPRYRNAGMRNDWESARDSLLPATGLTISERKRQLDACFPYDRELLAEFGYGISLPPWDDTGAVAENGSYTKACEQRDRQILEHEILIGAVLPDAPIPPPCAPPPRHK